MMRRVAIVLMSAGLALPAVADSAVGRWRFETAEVNTCRLTGEMTIQPASNKSAGALACTFTITQACPGPPVIEIVTRQSCTGRQVNSYVTLDSKVETIVSVKPASRRADMEDRYAPDNFRVAIKPGGEEMTGTFVSIGQAFVRFVRVPDLSS